MPHGAVTATEEADKIGTAMPPRLLLLVAVLLAAPAPGRAAPRVDPLYESASRAFEDGDVPRALEELTRSIAAGPTARAHLLRASVYVRLGQIDEARADYERVLALEKSPKLRAQVQKLRAQLDTLPKARLQIRSQPPGATIYLDLKAEGPKGKTPQVVPVTPGRHRVMLELDGYDPFVQKDVIAVENQEIEVNAALTSRTPVAPPPVVPPPPVTLPPPPRPIATTLELLLPSGATAQLDGAPLPGAPPYALSPGPHRLVLTAPPPRPPSVARSWWLWTSVALVLAGVAVGVRVGVSLRRKTQFDIVRVFEK